MALRHGIDDDMDAGRFRERGGEFVAFPPVDPLAGVSSTELRHLCGGMLRVCIETLSSGAVLFDAFDDLALQPIESLAGPCRHRQDRKSLHAVGFHKASEIRGASTTFVR